MTGHVGDLVRSLRSYHNWTIGDLASRLGSPPGKASRNKTCRMIAVLECEGHCPNPTIEAQVLEVLGADRAELEAIEQKTELERQRAFETWVSVFEPPSMWPRFIPGVALKVPFPRKLQTQQELEQHACEYASAKQVRMVLQFSRRYYAFINVAGVVEHYAERTADSTDPRPISRIGGKAFFFTKRS